MEYPFLHCPKQSADTAGTKPAPPLHPDKSLEITGYTPETVAKLIRQAIILEEESMKLLDLLVELIEQKPQTNSESNESPYEMNFDLKNRLYPYRP
jgi:hypothetical protein